MGERAFSHELFNVEDTHTHQAMQAKFINSLSLSLSTMLSRASWASFCNFLVAFTFQNGSWRKTTPGI